MKALKELSKEELEQQLLELKAKYKEFKDLDLSLNMSRGKPSKAQLDLSMGILDTISSTSDLNSISGDDCRNYGVMDGIKEAKQLMADIMEVSPENLIVYGNSSLNIMYDLISKAMVFGIMGNTPWGKLDKVKFLCPVPGYDRHFAITEMFGIEMINIPMSTEGPDMDMVEQYVNNDESVKGIWCTPMYSNPQGVTYSSETVARFANLKPKAKDFRIFWDNAYCVHHLYENDMDHVDEIISACEKAGNPDIVYKLSSTSKISFSGGGLAALASSKSNLADVKKNLTVQTIGHDKINQLRHARYFKDLDGIKAHMMKHAAIIRPKFEMVLDLLENELGDLEVANWVKPKGGYFIAFESMDGCAKKIVAMAKEAGVVLTNAGATYPYGKDPHDSSIRIAPTLPPVEELKTATELFIVCVKIASIEKILEAK